MKRLGLLLMLALIPFMGIAQNKLVTDFQNKYKDDKDANYIEISGSLFKFISSVSDSENEDMDPDLEAISRIADGLTAMQVLKVDKYASDLGADEIDDLRQALKKDNYETLMSMKEGRQRINFMAQGKQDELRNMLIVIDDRDEFVLISIDGVLSSDDLAYISRQHNRWTD